jgi:hypothetical protein
MRRAALLVMCAGCFVKPDRPAAHHGDGGGDGGGPVLDGPAPQHNIMFVSSLARPSPWEPIATQDGWCTMAAQHGNLPGNYVAWLSDQSRNIGDVLRAKAPAQQWYRPDGMLFAATVDAIATGMIANPPVIDETGLDATVADPSLQVATGTQPSGMAEPSRGADCFTGNIAIGMPKDAPSGGWTEAGYVPCNGASYLRLYCFSFDAP